MSTSTIYIDGVYAESNPEWHLADAPWKAAQVARMLTKHEIKPWRVADVGSGAGGVLAELKKSLPDGAVCDGYEISPQAHLMAQKVAGAGLQFHQGDFLTLKTAPYDLLLCLDVFEHVENPFAFLRALKSRAGAFVFHIPLDLSAQTVLRGSPLMSQRRQVGHLHFYTKDLALETLAASGYRVKDWFYTAAMDQHDGARAALMRLPRKALFAFSPDLAVRLLGGHSLLVLAE